MAPNGRSNIHDDAYQTDAYTWAGPLGRRLRVRSTFLVGECASLTFDAKGRIVTVCVGPEGPRLALLAPRTLELLAAFPLPPRVTAGGSPTSDFSGGGYFYLDHRDRAVIPTAARQIWVVRVDGGPAGPGFEVARRHDVSSAVPAGDGIISVLPDWDGVLWFVTIGGVVGTVEMDGDVRSMRLEGEGIFNSFAVDETGGVFVVSDHALYRFDRAADGGPSVTWRQRYDRGNRQKPGQVSRGSGTTPTLVGQDLVAITDNADPRMRVLVYRRGRAAGDTAPICRKAVFAPGRGATDNSLIAAGRSLFVENNYGYDGVLATERGGSTAPGLARVDLVPGGCRVVWENEERAPSVVPKLSLATGLLYTYTKDPAAGDEDPWYLTAIDARTGETVWKRLAGRNLGFNNNWAPVSIGRDGTAYVGALGGLTSFRDTRS
jgi:hypothetical protein